MGLRQEITSNLSRQAVTRTRRLSIPKHASRTDESDGAVRILLRAVELGLRPNNRLYYLRTLGAPVPHLLSSIPKDASRNGESDGAVRRLLLSVELGLRPEKRARTDENALWRQAQTFYTRVRLLHAYIRGRSHVCAADCVYAY